MNTLTRIAIALTILLAGVALVPFADAQSGTFAWQKFANGYECTEACQMVSEINRTATPHGDKYLVQAFITVVDENGDLVEDAIVSAQWAKPNGITYSTRNSTGGDGVAMFETVSREGAFTITINNIFQEGWTFDPDGSVRTALITVP
jgi:hypothetical protein